MAKLDEIQVEDWDTAAEVKQKIADEFWRWYSQNRSRVVFRKTILFIPLRVTIGDLWFLFVIMFGEPDVKT